MNCRLCAE